MLSKSFRVKIEPGLFGLNLKKIFFLIFLKKVKKTFHTTWTRVADFHSFGVKFKGIKSHSFFGIRLHSLEWLLL